MIPSSQSAIVNFIIAFMPLYHRCLFTCLGPVGLYSLWGQHCMYFLRKLCVMPGMKQSFSNIFLLGWSQNGLPHFTIKSLKLGDRITFLDFNSRSLAIPVSCCFIFQQYYSVREHSYLGKKPKVYSSPPDIKNYYRKHKGLCQNLCRHIDSAFPKASAYMYSMTPSHLLRDYSFLPHSNREDL